VAASPIATQATTWSGQLRGLGFDAAATETGRTALQEAIDISRAPRLALVVLDDRIAYPPLREVVYQLRANRSSSAAPVIVMCEANRLDALRDLAEADPLTLIAPRVESDESMAELVEQALAHTSSALLAPELRRKHAEQSLKWMQELAEKGAPYDELKRDASLLSETTHAAELTEPSLNLLANVGTGAAQLSLVNYANSPGLPLESRRLAVESLASNVHRYSVQLTRSQILQQYDRYNSSETADLETQQLLSRVPDIIEGKDQPSPESVQDASK
jgi:CheY-like chemotaxis protein